MSNIISLFSNNTQITFQRQEDGYINATSLCKSVGREFHTWNRSKKTSEYGKFTVERLVGTYDTFKKPAELNK